MKTEELRALAEAATPGLWHVEDADGNPAWVEPMVVAGEQYICQTIYDHQSGTYRPDPEGHIKDAKYIAALSPARVLLMLDAIDKMERIADNKGFVCDCGSTVEEWDELRAALAALKEGD